MAIFGRLDDIALPKTDIVCSQKKSCTNINQEQIRMNEEYITREFNSEPGNIATYFNWPVLYPLTDH